MSVRAIAYLLFYVTLLMSLVANWFGDDIESVKYLVFTAIATMFLLSEDSKP